MTPLQLSRSVRSLNRLRHIAKVLTRHGFGHIVAQLDLGRFVPTKIFRRREPKDGPEPGSLLGRRLAQVCADLGPTFVKLGQFLSTRPDIVPSEVLKELRKLQDQVPAFDTKLARNIIAQELGKPIADCFEQIDDQPFATASIGQVYKALTTDGRAVVIKVRRPEIDSTIRLDMHLLRWMAQSIERFVPELSMYRPVMLVDELDQALTRELDYINEASATERFAQAFDNVEGIHIPKVDWDRTSERVLTLEAIQGERADVWLDPERSAIHHIDCRLVARRLTECYLKQIFELGVFHADPHPGNILVTAPATVTLIDFGQVGTLSRELMSQIVTITYAAVNREMEVVVETLADMGATGSDTDSRSLRRALQVLLNKYYGLPIKRLNISTLFNELADVIRQHDVVIPRDLSLLLKALSALDGVTRQLDPDLNLLELIQPRVRKAISKQFSPDQVSRATTLVAWDLLTLLRRGPGQVRSLLRRLGTHGWELNIKHGNLDRLTKELDRSSNRLAVSIVIAAIIVGSSVVISTGSGLRIVGINVQYFGLVGYLIAGFFGLGLSWAIFRSGRLH